MVLLTCLIIAVLLIAAIIGLFVYRTGSRQPVELPDAEWLSSFSPERYRPMLRLLSEEDYDWLASQGLDSKSIAALRNERRAIFRTYLSNIARDFSYMNLMAQSLLLTLSDDQPELVVKLVTVRVSFQRTMLMVRTHLLLNRLGLHAVDASSLVAGLEEMHGGLQKLLNNTTLLVQA